LGWEFEDIVFVVEEGQVFLLNRKGVVEGIQGKSPAEMNAAVRPL
jgi:hypothetical protein